MRRVFLYLARSRPESATRCHHEAHRHRCRCVAWNDGGIRRTRRIPPLAGSHTKGKQQVLWRRSCVGTSPFEQHMSLPRVTGCASWLWLLGTTIPCRLPPYAALVVLNKRGSWRTQLTSPAPSRRGLASRLQLCLLRAATATVACPMRRTGSRLSYTSDESSAGHRRAKTQRVFAMCREQETVLVELYATRSHQSRHVTAPGPSISSLNGGVHAVEQVRDRSASNQRLHHVPSRRLQNNCSASVCRSPCNAYLGDLGSHRQVRTSVYLLGASRSSRNAGQ